MSLRGICSRLIAFAMDKGVTSARAMFFAVACAHVSARGSSPGRRAFVDNFAEPLTFYDPSVKTVSTREDGLCLAVSILAGVRRIHVVFGNAMLRLTKPPSSYHHCIGRVSTNSGGIHGMVPRQDSVVQMACDETVLK